MQLIGLLLLWSVRALNGERLCPPLLRYEHDAGALSHEKVPGIQRSGRFKAGAVRVSGIGGCVPVEMVGKLRQGDGHGLPGMPRLHMSTRQAFWIIRLRSAFTAGS